MRRIFLLLSFLTLQLFGAEVIPASARVPWIPGVTIGVPGGIPTNRTTIINVTQAPYNVDNTGASNALPGLEEARDDAFAAWELDGIPRVLYCPTGTYRLDSGFGLYGYMTLRGDGPLHTTFVINGDHIGIGASDSGALGPALSISGSPVKGDDVLTVSSTATLSGSVGRAINVTLFNDTNSPIWGVSGYERLRRQRTVLAEIVDGTHIRISPALYFDLPASLAPVFTSRTGQVEFTGFEDFTLDASGSNYASPVFGLNYAYGCWLKNVTIYSAKKRQLSIDNSMLCEVRHCTLGPMVTPGSNGYGFGNGGMSGVWFEDNILLRAFPTIEQNGGSSGNVYSYNFVVDSQDNGTIGASFDSCHDPWQSHNLWEGNIGPRYQSDNYFGGTSDETLFRNWFHATSPTGTGNHFAVTINRGGYNYNVVGNLLGRTDAGITFTVYNNTGASFNSTSPTSIAIPAYGDDVAIDVGLGKLYATNNCFVVVYSAASPSTNWFSGKITAYEGSGFVNIRVGSTHGSGTYSDWVVVAANGYGDPSIYALGGPNIGTGGVLGDFTGAIPTMGLMWRCWNAGAYRPGGIQPDGTQPNTPYNSASAYTTGMIVEYDSTGSAALTGSSGTVVWMANNPSKDGLTTWVTPGPSQTDWMPLGSNSFQEWDLSVGKTTNIRWNWNANSSSIPAVEALGGDTVPDSFIYDSKPAFFGNLAWPPINPASPPTGQGDDEVFAIIPAAYRYYFGVDPPQGGTIANVGTLNVGSINKIP